MTEAKARYDVGQLNELQFLENKIAHERLTGIIEDRKLHRSFEQLIEDHWNLREPKLCKGLKTRENKGSIVVTENGKVIAKVRKIKVME